MSLNVTLRTILAATHLGSADLSIPQDQLKHEILDTLSDGTGSGEANTIWYDRRTLASGADDDLAMQGALEDAFGETVNFDRVLGILIHNRNAYAGDILSVGGGSDDAGTDAFDNWTVESDGGGGSGKNQILIPGQGFFFLWSPVTGYVVLSSNILRISNASGGHEIEYDVILLGIDL